MGKISIIMAAYNAEKTLAAAVESVIKQTYADWELIIVDDCSVDHTAEIALQYANEDIRIRFLQNEQNSGVSYSRKRAACAADGDWIAILDSDDAWKSDKLEKQMRLQEKTGAELLYTASAFMDTDGNLLGWQMQVPQQVDYRQLLKQNVISNSSALVRKDLYLQYYVENDAIHEDFALWLKILRTGMIARGVNEALLIYRISRNSKTGNKRRSAGMTWNTYRYVGVPLTQAMTSMICYTVRSFQKYFRIFRKT